MLKWFLRGSAAAVILYAGLASALIAWPSSDLHRFEQTRTMAALAAEEPAGNFSQSEFHMRDGTILHARLFGAPAPTTILLLHGVGSDGRGLVATAQALNARTGAHIVVIDLRGHGLSGGKRWSADYAGQYDDDVSDVIAALRKHGAQKIVLGGHSMGGGVALRHAFRTDAPVDGYLMFAPNLGSDAPSARNGSDQSPEAAAYAVFRTPRLIGAIMFDIVGIHAFDQLPIFYLNAPGQPEYGLAALSGMQPNAPQDYRAAFKEIAVPLLVLAGTKDEAFNAAAYPAIVKDYSKGDAALIDGASHESILQDGRALDRVGQWMADNAL